MMTVVAGKTTLQSQQIRQLQMQKRPGQVQIQGQQKVTGNLSCLPLCMIDETYSCVWTAVFSFIFADFF